MQFVTATLARAVFLSSWTPPLNCRHRGTEVACVVYSTSASPESRA